MDRSILILSHLDRPINSVMDQSIVKHFPLASYLIISMDQSILILFLLDQTNQECNGSSNQNETDEPTKNLTKKITQKFKESINYYLIVHFLHCYSLILQHNASPRLSYWLGNYNTFANTMKMYTSGQT